MDASIRSEVRHDRRVLAGVHGSLFAVGGPLELLMPADWDQARLADKVDGQAVIGPASQLGQAHEAIALTRGVASLLRGGTVTDARRLVSHADHLGSLLVGQNRLLADLLAKKHLQPLAGLKSRRRLVLAELLLDVLERGGPLRHVARDQGVSPQTAHNRMEALHTLMGDKLDNPDQRVEIIIALRATLPRWQKEN